MSGESGSLTRQSTRSCGPVEAALREQPFDYATAQWRRWRVGRKVGRTIYAQLAERPSDDDVLIGVMDTSGLAHDAVNCHNELLRKSDHE